MTPSRSATPGAYASRVIARAVGPSGLVKRRSGVLMRSSAQFPEMGDWEVGNM